MAKGKKQKTRKAISKRIKLTKNGIKRLKASKNHRITGKGKTIRKFKKGIMLNKTTSGCVKRAIPGL